MTLLPRFYCNLRFLLIAAIPCPGPAIAADIGVRLIDIKTGQPMKNQTIELFLGEPRPSTPALKATSSPDGSAAFHIPEPLPSDVWVYIENGHLRDCASQLLFSTADIVAKGMQSGLRERGRCTDKRKLVGKVKARPGEIVVFVRRLSFWERGRR